MKNKEKQVTKRIIILFVMMIFILSLGCMPKTYDNYQELENGLKLQRGDITYNFVSALPRSSLIGKQIGIINEDKKHKIFEVNGFSSNEWVIEYYDVIMSTYSLYKSDTVKEIPDELK